ncbi:N-glycosidase [Colletotrichum orbiculare MAFF 240422]|uniref:N-glycosidase n=1 Tax=Colletotrichum orbiculare (strain 104-T / ATCC 96160 / CBS 514.97 / LARS 414 / MAFF 240422) TaxID=1213857 RepID=N4V6C1_COLOR|nr:N-glycosidase [Colletotrichum orbiculare MAFF 240422]
MKSSTSPIFFWRETGPHGYLSQWSPHPFTSPASSATSSPAATFETAEHYMMHGKALLFSDTLTALSILQASSPRSVKALGRKVAPFDEAVWTAERENIVREGNLLKFRAHPDLRAALLATGDRELAGASPRDRVWGIGYSPDKAPHTNRSAWGLNLLGKVLMQVREELRREEETGEETGEGKAKEDEGKKTTAEA